MSLNAVNPSVEFDAGLMHLPKFLRQLGVSRSTGWRWIKAGLLRTSNIYGRQYVTRAARDEFLARVEAGEFARTPVTPSRHASTGADGAPAPGAERRGQAAVSLIEG